MMSEEKNNIKGDAAQELEFIDVEAGEMSTSSVSSPTNSSNRQTPKNQNNQESETLISSLRKSVTNAKHPVAAFFHLFFKICALTMYLFGGFFSFGYVFTFVICILFLAFDFWTVKNITGRLLVGLRWWNKINEDGTNEWIFESHEDLTVIDPLDARVFWTGLYLTPTIWILLLIVAILKFNIQWALIVFVAVTLSIANIIGYTKCKKDAKQKMQSLMSQGALGALGTEAGSAIFSKFGNLAMNGFASASSSSVATTKTQQQQNVVV